MKMVELTAESMTGYDKKREPVVQHHCRMPKEEDLVTTLYPGRDICSRITRWITRKRVMSIDHYYAQTCLKSSTAMKNEISRHLQNFPYMIHPFSPVNNAWSMLMTVFTSFMMIITPVLNAYYYERHWNTLPILVAIDTVMMFDVGMHFVTGHYDQRTKSVEMDPVVVATSYLRGWFILDLVSAIPVELFDYMTHGRDHETWWCSLFNFMKIFRMRNLLNYIRQFRKAYYISFQKIKLVELAVIVFISIHWSACIVFYVPIVVADFKDDPIRNLLRSLEDDNKPWVNSLENQTLFSGYIGSLNRATISLISASHYLNVATREDMIMNFVLAVWGKLGYIYILSQFLLLMTSFHSSNKERLRQLKQLREYMQYKELPLETQKRLLVYYNYWHKKNFNRDIHIFAQVSEPLREELILHNYTRLLETVDLFQLLPQEAIVQLANSIKTEICLLNDVIVKSGTKGENLYFIGSGTVAVYTSLGKEVCHLEDGSYFGEIALVMENEHRIANVVAIETCELLKVQRDAFQTIIAPYPNLLIRLQKVAIERLEKTLLLDEIYRLDDPNPNYINISNIRGKRRE